MKTREKISRKKKIDIKGKENKNKENKNKEGKSEDVKEYYEEESWQFSGCGD